MKSVNTMLAVTNLAVSIGVASMAAGAVGAGPDAKIGAHAFSWGYRTPMVRPSATSATTNGFTNESDLRISKSD